MLSLSLTLQLWIFAMAKVQLIQSCSAVVVRSVTAQCLLVASTVTLWEKSFICLMWRFHTAVKAQEQLGRAKFNTVHDWCLYKNERTVVGRGSTFFTGWIPDTCPTVFGHVVCWYPMGRTGFELIFLNYVWDSDWFRSYFGEIVHHSSIIVKAEYCLAYIKRHILTVT